MNAAQYVPDAAFMTDMEQEGVLVDNEHLAAMEEVAKKDQESKENIFRSWAAQYVPDAAFMNVGSGPQIRQLLFAGVPNQKPDLGDLEVSRTFKIPNTTGHIEPGREGKPPLKNRNIELFSVFGREEPTRFGVDVYTPSGWPAVSTPVLRTLAGKPGTAQKALDTSPSASLDPEDESDNDDVHSLRYESDDANPLDELPIAASYSSEAALEEQIAQGYGKAYSAFGGGHAGLSACAAIDALCDMAAIDTLLSNFILPLQGGEIKGPKGRVHCSMNINTDRPAERSTTESAEPARPQEGPLQDPQSLHGRSRQDAHRCRLRAAGAAPAGPHGELRKHAEGLQARRRLPLSHSPRHVRPYSSGSRARRLPSRVGQQRRREAGAAYQGHVCFRTQESESAQLLHRVRQDGPWPGQGLEG